MFKLKKSLNPAQKFAQAEKLRQKKRNRLEREKRRQEVQTAAKLSSSFEDLAPPVFPPDSHKTINETRNFDVMHQPPSQTLCPKPCRPPLIRPCVITSDDRVILPSVSLSQEPDNDEEDSSSTSTTETDSEGDSDDSEKKVENPSGSTGVSHASGLPGKENMSAVALVAREEAILRLNHLTAQKKNKTLVQDHPQGGSSSWSLQSDLSQVDDPSGRESEELDPLVQRRLDKLRRISFPETSPALPQEANLSSSGLPVQKTSQWNQPLSSIQGPSHLNVSHVTLFSGHPMGRNKESQGMDTALVEAKGVLGNPPLPGVSNKTAHWFVPTGLRLQHKPKVLTKGTGTHHCRAFGRASLAKSAKSANNAMMVSSTRTSCVSPAATVENEKNLEMEFRSFMEAVSKSIE